MPATHDSFSATAMTSPLVIFVTHSEHASPGAVGEALGRLGLRTATYCPMRGDELPGLSRGCPDGAVATVVFGGPQCLSEIDQYPYLHAEISWIGEQLGAGAPVLGICLGAQIIASALGAAVGPHPEGLKEIGYHPIRPTAAGRALIEDDFHAYQWHGEGFELPDGAELLATGALFPNQAFRVGDKSYGLQFHPEMTRSIMERWIGSEKGAPQLRRPEAQSAEAQCAAGLRHEPRVHAWLERFLRGWLDLA
jgi:GMP synthase (glutamine-hydrolysing)